MRPLLPIEKITVYTGKMPVNLRFSYGVVNFFPFAIVEIESGRFKGIGEAAGLVKVYEKAAKDLLGKDAACLEGNLPEYLDLQEHNEEREALSIALYDLVGKAYNVPVHMLLGGKRRERVPLMPCIFSSNPREAGDKAIKFTENGFRYLKVKFIGNLKEDTAILKAIRKGIGDDIYIQADVNRGYKDYQSIKEALKYFEEWCLTVIEDPLDGTFEQYRRLRQESRVKIMVDFYTRSLKSVRICLRNEAADIINQHPGQQGGLQKAIIVHSAARVMGVPTIVGGTGFTGLGTAAFQSLASVIGLGFPCGELCGVIDHGFECKFVKELYTVKNGEALIPDTSGLGVELDRNMLHRFAEKRYSFSNKK